MFYKPAFHVQPHRKEIIQNLDQLVQRLMDLYYEKHQRYPERIIYFRDGVGELQYNEVYFDLIFFTNTYTQVCRNSVRNSLEFLDLTLNIN